MGCRSDEVSVKLGKRLDELRPVCATHLTHRCIECVVTRLQVQVVRDALEALGKIVARGLTIAIRADHCNDEVSLLLHVLDGHNERLML